MIGRKVGELLPGVGADKPRLSDVGFIWRDLPSPPAPGGTGPLAPCSVCTSPHSSSYSAGSPPGWGSPDCSPARPQFQPRRQSSCWRWEIWVEASLSDRTAAGRMSWRRCLISPAGSSWWSRWAELRSGCWRDSTLQRKKDKSLPGSELRKEGDEILGKSREEIYCAAEHHHIWSEQSANFSSAFFTLGSNRPIRIKCWLLLHRSCYTTCNVSFESYDLTLRKVSFLINLISLTDWYRPSHWSDFNWLTFSAGYQALSQYPPFTILRPTWSFLGFFSFFVSIYNGKSSHWNKISNSFSHLVGTLEHCYMVSSPITRQHMVLLCVWLTCY